MNKVDKRKSHEDRRKLDIGPPKGWLERRKRVERRIPEAAEIEVSETEWALYFGSRSSQTNIPDDPASEIFERVRD